MSEYESINDLVSSEIVRVIDLVSDKYMGNR